MSQGQPASRAFTSVQQPPPYRIYSCLQNRALTVRLALRWTGNAGVFACGESSSLYSTSSLTIKLTAPFFSQFDLGPDPRLWGAELSLDYVEDDDELHRPTAGKSRIERDGNFISTRGVANLGCTAILILGLLALL